MSLLTGETIIWYGLFKTDGVGKTGLTDVLIDIWKDNNTEREVADNECTPLGGGFYFFIQSSPAAGFRVAKMKTEDTTVDSKEIGCIQLVGKGGVDYLDASIATVDGVVDSIESKTDIIDSNVDDIEIKVDNLDSDLVIVDGKVDIIDTNVDSANTNISTILTKITTIHKIETGRWRITNNQFIIYDEDGTTPLLTFNLKDQLGDLTMENPFERTPA